MYLKVQLFLILFISTGNFVFSNEINMENGLRDVKKLYRSGLYQEVVTATEKILKLDPKNEEVRNLLAFALFQLKNYKSIIQLYTDTQAEFIASPVQLKLRTIAQTKEGNFFSAMLSYRNLREDETLKEGWKSFYHYLVFKINKQSAIKELKRMNKVAPNISYNIIMGDLYAVDGEYAKAIESFELALKTDYLNIEVMEKLGDNYFRNRDYEKARVVYQSLLTIKPERSDVKIKMAWTLEKNNQFLDALKMLEFDQSPHIVNYRTKLLSRVQNYMNNTSVRAIAATEEVSPIDGKLSLEEKFIPIPPLEIGAEETPILIENSLSSEEQLKLNENIHEGDKSTLEFSLGPKAKKYDLTGAGFNAKVDYSSGMAIGLNYTFLPEERDWETVAFLDHSRTSLKNLSGLVPNHITLTESRLGLGVNYKMNSFSFGPALLYEKMTANQTTPKPVRGNVNIAYLGARFSYLEFFNDKINFKFDLSYFSKFITTSKTRAVGSVDRREAFSGALKLYFKVNPTVQYFTGLMFARTNTSYVASQERGTAGAKEKEQDITLPIGINYVF